MSHMIDNRRKHTDRRASSLLYSYFINSILANRVEHVLREIH
jgi:hypothetical protein